MSAGRFLDQKATFDVLPRLIDIWDSKYWSGGCINRTTHTPCGRYPLRRNAFYR
jgi:hypothetical protein